MEAPTEINALRRYKSGRFKKKKTTTTEPDENNNTLTEIGHNISNLYEKDTETHEKIYQEPEQNKFVIEGRRIVDITFFVEQLERGCYACREPISLTKLVFNFSNTHLHFYDAF